MKKMQKSQASKVKDKDNDLRLIEEDFKSQDRQIEREISAEEKKERQRIDKEIEDLRRIKLSDYEKKLKQRQGKPDFEDLLDEYTKQRKIVERDIQEEQRIMEEDLKRRLDDKRATLKMENNEERRQRENDLEKRAGGDVVNTRKVLQQKAKLLEKESRMAPKEVFDEECVKREIPASLVQL